MSAVGNAIAALFLLGTSAAVSIAGLINGYGLHVVSWGWIIGSFLVNVVLLGLIHAIKE